jgi:hypothetical protein
MTKHTSENETTYTYQGFAYKQNSSPQTPWIVSFVASAEEIREWSSIPRRGKTEQGNIGFQRADDEKRVQKAASFFKKSPLNQSPTAIVLGLHPNKREIISELRFDDVNDTGDIRKCRLEVKINSSLNYT